ncbi:hypothetical protein B0H11DRAFT_2255036 [Mycena galericulata]|nr:hypothetical protein B0H11DRAFT_2255036 [Mycena galericulata]
MAVAAAPGLPRGNSQPTPATIRQFTTGAIAEFLAAHQGDNQPFNVAGPWQTVNYAGNAGNLTTAQINNDIYQACDTQADRLTNNTVSFSSSYTNFAWNATDNANGNDSDVYITARVNIEPLLTKSALVPGINMVIQKDGTTNPQDGSLVPYYAIPTLNATLSAWQSGSGLSPFKYTSSEHNVSMSSSSSFGGAEFGIIFDNFEGGFGGEHKASQSSLDLQANSYELSFGALALLEVDQGHWFDDYRLAKAAQNPDTNHTGAQAIFNQSTFFGSAQKPGPLSVYNAYALVGFQPGFTIAFTDIKTDNSSTSSESGFEIGNLGLAEIGGYAGSTSNSTSFDQKTNTLTIKDNSANAYIIGFVQNTFWTIPS